MPELDRGWNGAQIVAPGGIAEIPNSATIVTSTRTKIKALVISNPTGGTVTVTIRSGNATGTIVGVIPVATNTTYVWPPGFPSGCDGVLFPTGFSWGASATGTYGEVIGTKTEVA